jgi:hypothetical protein
VAFSVLISSISPLGRAVNALDGCLRWINLAMKAFQLSDEFEVRTQGPCVLPA